MRVATSRLRLTEVVDKARPRRSRRGMAIVELACFVPVLMVVVFATIEAARMCMVSQLLTNAAREGCRVAATNGKASADVTSRVNATLIAAGFTTAQATQVTGSMSLTPSSIETTAGNTPITLTLSLPMNGTNGVNWLSSPYFFRTTTMTISGKAVMLSQRP